MGSFNCLIFVSILTEPEYKRTCYNNQDILAQSPLESIHNNADSVYVLKDLEA